MTHVAEFSLTYPTPATAERVATAIRPEVGDIEGDRTRASLAREDAELSITIEAEDLVALRAGINTWLSLTDVAERAGETAADASGKATEE